MASEEEDSDLPEEYNMDHKRRGLALIFNQENFSEHAPRRGTDQDKEALTKRFEELGFEVNVYNDEKRKDILDRAKKVAEEDHTDADCFVCVVLSHGDEGNKIFATDEEVNIKEITHLFKEDKCKSLAGKPKIFIFQACRGKHFENAVTPMAGGDEEVEEQAVVCTLPAGEDFLMCYSVSEGFYSFRDSNYGGFYIQDLCKTLQTQGSTLEFTELLTLVNLKVSRCDIGVRKWKQMPCFTSMLTKKLYFRPKP
ncbi:caspase-6-like [Hoplias malabaricus]|uniref:caspase-6-like n=1 Tax=Hoplias malabaricus TaxID=27720 RepID=UPI003463428B